MLRLCVSCTFYALKQLHLRPFMRSLIAPMSRAMFAMHAWEPRTFFHRSIFFLHFFFLFLRAGSIAGYKKLGVTRCVALYS